MLQEKHHACIIAAFWKTLKEQHQENALLVFRKAEQFYGERRGRRMAQKALRDGLPLNYESYFLYGELLSTPNLTDVDLSFSSGIVNEKVTRCPWCNEFARIGYSECGMFYCREIDAAVVRGFNPYLYYQLIGNIYDKGSCDFIYKDDSITSDLMEKLSQASSDNKRDFNYHCADIFQAFSKVVENVYPEDYRHIIEKVRAFLYEQYGDELIDILDNGKDLDFESV